MRIKLNQGKDKKIQGSEVLVLNTLRKEKHISHFALDEGIILARELNIGSTYFTHLSHQMGRHEDVTRELPEGVNLSYDGLTLELPENGIAIAQQ